LPLLISAFVFTYVRIVRDISAGTERIKTYRETLIAERKDRLKNYTDIALKAIENLPQEDVAQAVKRLRYDKSGYFWINDFNAFMVSHPDPKLEGTIQIDLKDPNGVYVLREIIKVCKENSEGFIYYMWNIPGEEKPQPKISYAKTIKKWDWIIATGIYISDINDLVGREELVTKKYIASSIYENIIIAFIIVIALSILTAYLVSKYINKPISVITNGIKNFGNDLTKKIALSSDDEIGELGGWFNNHTANLYGTITKVSEATNGINSHATEIAAAVGQQAATASEESAAVMEITSTMEELSASSTQIADHSKAVVDIATKTWENTKRGADALESLIIKMDEISTDNQKSITEIVDLGRKSKEISKVMEIINTIADQTKLIAFNAAIEASSAGEAGKRFGVVAVEIRRLADSVMESTGEIESKISEIQEAINRLVIASEKGSKGIHEGMEYSNQTAGILSDIVGAAQTTTDAAKQISLSTQQQKTASNQVVVALREIVSGSSQTSDSMFRLNLVSKELAELSNTLKGLVGEFKLGNNQKPLERVVE